MFAGSHELKIDRIICVIGKKNIDPRISSEKALVASLKEEGYAQTVESPTNTYSEFAFPDSHSQDSYKTFIYLNSEGSILSQSMLSLIFR